MLGLTTLSLVALTQSQDQIKIDPLLIVQAHEIWKIIGQDENPVWKGWDARKTPILIYFPNKQEILINHPHPPAEFKKYQGSMKSSLGSIYLRNGKTTFDLDGQNTTTEINGIRTLVVADTLSTRRQMIQSISGSVVDNPSDALEIIQDNMGTNVLSTMTLIAHEAFHVYQEKNAPNKQSNEMMLARYPSLSVDNNVWLAIEAEEMASALHSKNSLELRQHAIKWFAARQARREVLSQELIDYEDAVEFSEGTAKYIEYKLMDVLKTQKPAQEMWLIQGFKGYGDEAEKEKESLIQNMKGFMNGSNIVNNDPYGASPVRFRHYYSGMAIGALLDKLGTNWHDPILKTPATLTSLVNSTLKPTQQELDHAKKELLNSELYQKLRVVKEQLKQNGMQHIQEEVQKFSEAPGELVIDYSLLEDTPLQMAFTPFGILNIDDERKLFRLIPIRGKLGDFTFSEDSARPVMINSNLKRIHFRLTGELPEISTDEMNEEKLELPGVSLMNINARVKVDGKRLTLTLLPK